MSHVRNILVMLAFVWMFLLSTAISHAASTVQTNDSVKWADETDSAEAIVGNKPWITLLCKFSDVAGEPHTVAYAQGMYANTKPRLDHFWREVSYNKMNLAGSSAAGWFVVAPKSSYSLYEEPGLPPVFYWGKFFNDCVGAANASVDFSPYAGIFMVMNGYPGVEGSSGGSFLTRTIDGVNKRWYVGWTDPGTFATLASVERIMGYAFGWRYSSNASGNSSSAWDLMSSQGYGCSVSDPVYGCAGQHTIALNKDVTGWIPAAQKYVLSPNSQATLTMERLAQPATSNYKLIQIPIGGSSTRFYTLEARRRIGYDAGLPGNAVIIHEVIELQGRRIVVNSGNDDNPNDAGAMWLPGEKFTDATNNITVCVLSATNSGYVVTVASGVTPNCSSPNATSTRTGTATPTRTATRTGTATPTRTATRTATATAPSPSDWIFCANENKTCALPGTRLVRFGANNKYKFKTLSGSLICNGTTFGGDPLPGVAKRCDYNLNPNAATPTRTPTRVSAGCSDRPAVPMLVGPKEEATIRNGQATLKWQAVECATSYTIVITDAATKKQIEKQTGLTALEYQTSELKSGRLYQWKVIAVNEFGRSSSPLREIKTK